MRGRTYKYKRRTYRSKFEISVAKQLYAAKVKFTYETKSYKWQDVIPYGQCGACGSKYVYTERSYTPDFFLPKGVVVEAKGKLDARQRKKLLAVKKSNPKLDLRILFMKDNKISSNSKTRYSEWAAKHGFIAAVEIIPKEWFK